MENKIYTWVGSNHTILLSVNPFQPLPLYSPEQIETHSHPPLNKPLPPHVYDIAYSAFQELVTDGTDQSILISGESGAGKTEATKQCLGFIAEIAGSDSNLEQRILQTNPILESFGNAKTVRNNNSSRFGKWIEVHFDNQNRICGASIECYLLEKSRVVGQQANERNFHIFYQLFTSSELRERYGLSSPGDYRYLVGGKCLSVNGIDDAADFVDVVKSFEALGFSTEERDPGAQLGRGGPEAWQYPVRGERRQRNASGGEGTEPRRAGGGGRSPLCSLRGAGGGGVHATHCGARGKRGECDGDPSERCCRVDGGSGL